MISFRQLSKKAVADVDDVSRLSVLATIADDQFDLDVGRATGSAEVHDDFVSKLSRIVQLTGTPFRLTHPT